MEASNFFSRLLKQPKSNTQVIEVDDIGEFDKAWRSIQDTLEHPDERQLLKGIQSTEVPRLLRHLVDALVHESNQIDEETLGGCMEYFVNNDILANLERLCEKDRPHGIKSEVLKALNNLIVLLPDKFLVHNSIHRPLRRLLKSCIGDAEISEGEINGSARMLGAAAAGIDFRGDVEGDLVDLMCVLCSRMRAYPPLLLIFFHDKGWLQPNPSNPSTHSRTRSLSKAPSTISSTFEFLLFSYLLHFIHREGKTGDFARAGLLFLFDIAFLPSEETTNSPTLKYDDSLIDARRALAGYILDGDFVDVMAAGLGAVWSLLPSKLKVPGIGEIISEEEEFNSGGMVLGQDGTDKVEEEEMRLSTDEDVRVQTGMLLKLFGFIQDMLVRRDIDLLTIDMDAYETESELSESEPEEPSISRIWSALVDSSLDAVQSSFLENVLYPSILECSPQDGSSVAILTYLDIIFSNIDNGTLLDRFVDYLLCRGMCKSEDEERFTLKDLILDNINSRNAGAITAGMKLLGTILREHCDIATSSLLSTIGPGYAQEPPCPIPNSNELELYASLVERLDHSQSSLEYSSSYASYLSDTHAFIQNDKCFQLYQMFQSSGNGNEAPPIGKHRLETHNVMLQSLLSSLSQFLCRGPNENIALTGVFTSMAQCPFRSLEGWLIFDTDTKTKTDPWASQDEKQQSQNQERPTIYSILSSLVSQISKFRSQIPNFDILLQERRSGLLYTENIDEAMNLMLDVGVEPSIFAPAPMPVTPTPKKKGVMGTLASYLTPTRSPASPAPVTPQRQSRMETGVESPYKVHYEMLVGKEVEAVPTVIEGLQRPSIALGRSTSSQNTSSSRGETLAQSTPHNPTEWSDDAGRRLKGEEEGKGKGKGKKMSLSITLDNCIILEEFIKELIAIISARRGLGIDAVSFS